MTVDPTEPDTFEEDDALGPEAPEADAAEQHRELLQQDDEPEPRFDPSSADPADAVEQSRVVSQDEDDYR
ncbi:hypothetical protein G6045_25865 [Streptomyces sp. YC504]|uniref:DUF5709 domain-containing protein n=1 Tax=Streptomyces mesophilus TaxID=1775132 RepID=A0A6G4XNC5_9ACTN|nr:hypothetical protein [Streptomyces mesophilus]NGO79055.1 hypothetical protein [Streptomyces mesophilus]